MTQPTTRIPGGAGGSSRARVAHGLEIGDLVPTPEFREFHARLIEASPEDVWAALHEVPASEVAVTRLLMRLLQVGPARGPDRAAYPLDARLWDAMPVPVVHEVESVYALAAMVGRPWSREEPPLSLDGPGVAAFDEPGWAKVATDFRLTATPDATILSTETRVVTTDAASRRRFGVYWMAIRPFSGLIRRDVLAAVDRAARRRPRAGRPVGGVLR